MDNESAKSAVHETARPSDVLRLLANARASSHDERSLGDDLLL